MFDFTFRLGRIAVAAAIAVAITVVVSSSGVVQAQRARPANSKTFACSSGTACLTGKATGTAFTNGVEGASTATSGRAYGVEGTSATGAGVYGSSTAHVPSEPEAGVEGGQENSKSDSGNGVYAESADTTQVYEALYAQADNANADIFEATNAVNGSYCAIDGNANLTCVDGSGEAKSLHLRHRTATGRPVLTSGSESASATLEDAGSARLVDGAANVALDPTFVATVDPSNYYVFVTPTGDTRGLYVSAKTPSGFQVREAEGGRSTLSFDYRIVARPLDARNDQLPPAPALRRVAP